MVIGRKLRAGLLTGLPPSTGAAAWLTACPITEPVSEAAGPSTAGRDSLLGWRDVPTGCATGADLGDEGG